MSEIATVTLELKDLAILDAVVRRMGGQVLGHGIHELYERSVEGFGFKLPGLYYPFVVTDGGLRVITDGDNLRSKPEALEHLKSEYALQVAESEAEKLGYVHERINEGGMGCVKVYFPAGSEVIIKADGHVEGFGFNGVGCDAARQVFSDALGTTEDLVFKDEYFRESVKLPEFSEI